MADVLDPREAPSYPRRPDSPAKLLGEFVGAVAPRVGEINDSEARELLKGLQRDMRAAAGVEAAARA